MVRGEVATVTPVPGTNQCAETQRMARGRGISRPKADHASVYRFRLSAFMGFPCPKKMAGSILAHYDAAQTRRSSPGRTGTRRTASESCEKSPDEIFRVRTLP